MTQTDESWADAAGVDLTLAFDALRRTVRINRGNCESDARWNEAKHNARDEWAVAVTETFEKMVELAEKERKHIESLQNTVNWLAVTLLAVGVLAAYAFNHSLGLLK